MSTGVASPPSHPPLPKKPSLAPKPKGLAVTTPRNTLIEGDSIESITSTSSSDTITNDSSPVTPDIQTSNHEASKPKGSPSRPTPKPRKTINYKANGTPGEVAPSPRPRVLPKRNIPQQESDQSPPAEESSSSTLPNGNECDVVTNGTTSTPRERPNVPVRRLTLGSSDLTPKVCPQTSPKWSPVRAPLQRSNSSMSDYSASSSSVTDGESDTQPSNVLSDTKGDEQNNSSTGPQIETENKDANTSVPTHRSKPNISPKKPSLAMLSKRNTMFSIDSVSFDKDNEKLPSENGKKALPQRPSLPPKRLSVIPVPQGSPSKPTVKSKPPAQQSTEVPKEDPPQINGDETEELSDVVPSSGEPSNNNSLATKDIAEKHSTLKSTNYEPTSAASSGTKINQPVEDPKAPSILPRKTIPRNPVAPPRRVKSMSESDPNFELNSDVKRSDESNKETSCLQSSLERHMKLQSEGEERNGSKLGDNSDNSISERSTFKRNRRAVKSCDHLAFDSMKSPKDKRKVSNSEVQQKQKPPRPPPPSKPPGLIHQASLQGPPPRPKPVRAKTIDMTSQAKEKVKTESRRTSKQNSPIKSKKLNQVTCGSGETAEFRPSENENPDSLDWEFIDLTPQQKQQIDETGRGKIVNSESFKEVANHKPKNDAEIEPEHKDRLTPSKKSTNEQPEQPEKQVSKSEETWITKESEPETKKQPPGEAVSQLKLRKAQPPVPAQRNSIEGSPVHKPSSTSVLEERDVSSGDRNSQEISGRPLSQGSPMNGRSPNSSPKKTLKDRGRGSSPRRPSCAPPPPPPGAPQPNIATPRAQLPSPNIAPVQPKSPAPKPKRPAPPRPIAPPIKTSPNSPSNSQKPALPKNNDAEEDQTNIYTEANAPFKNGEDGEDSDTSSRDHDYELIPDPRRTLTRNTEPTSSSDGETRKDSSNRASGYIDDGLYLEPNQREEKEEEEFENEYVYPEFMPANNIPVLPPTPPPNPELDHVFTPEHPPAESKSRQSSVPRRKAPQKPKRSQSVQSDASFDSHSYFDMTGGSENLERAHRSPSDRSGSLTDSSGNEDASLSDEEYDDEGSYAGVADLLGTEDDDLDLELPEARNRLQSLGKKAQKAFMVAKEIKDSEKVFVNVLKLLNVDLRQVIDEGSKKNGGKQVIEKAALDAIIGHLPHLLMFNECLLTDLETRIRNWSTTPKIADIFLTKGHFLKLYSTYILDFERITAAFDDACNKNPVFTQVVKEFEMSERCKSLAIKHYMLKPVQRIPQYKMLLTDYLKQLDADSEEFEKTTDALAIVSEVANHANESMRQGDNFEKLLAIQHSIIGNQEIVKPGRRFIKEGELLKMSRRVNQPRRFVLLSDILLYTTPFPPGQYKLNNVLSLAGMKVRRSSEENQESKELEIISVQRSFTLLASSKEESEAWYNALTKTIDEYENKKSTFDLIKQEHKGLAEGDTSSLGRKAPLWIPDSRVTMCMICTSEFTLTWRRHHCRACGKVTCGNCSKNKATLTYLSDKEARVCDNCYETLVVSQLKDGQDGKERTKNKSSKGNKTKRRKSNRLPVRPSALKVSAKDQSNSSMGGYLWLRVRKKDWKRMWYRIKDKVLYTYKASEDVVALSSTPLLGYAVCVINESFEGFEPCLILQLTQGRMKFILRSETPEACARWNEAMVEASCLD